MKVDLQSNINAYRKKIGQESAPLKTDKGTRETSGKTDVVDIARGNSIITSKKMATLKSGIQSYISRPTDTERLATLRESVKNGTYRIPTEDLVNAIMES